MSTIQEKIQKLIALSFSSNENEARNAMATAQAIADKHAIDLAALRDSRGAGEIKEVFANAIVDTGRRHWKMFLLVTLMDLHRVTAVTISRTSHVRLFGAEHDVQMCGEMFVWICDACYHYSKLAPSQEKTYLSSFRTGFVERVAQRLNGTRASLPSTALAVLKDKTRAKAYMETVIGPPPKKNKKIKLAYSSAMGHAHGRTAGGLIDLNRSKHLP